MFEISEIFNQISIHVPTFVLAFSLAVLLDEFGIKEKWRNLGAVGIAILTSFIMNGETEVIASKFFTATLSFLLFNQIIKILTKREDKNND
jgi:hypothetical protein